MQYHAIPCNTMQYHGTLITADGAYHCPVGSIMAIFSSVRSSNSHPDLLLIHPTTHPLFQITPVFDTGLSLSEPIQLYQGRSLDSSSGYMCTLWVQLDRRDRFVTEWCLILFWRMSKKIRIKWKYFQCWISIHVKIIRSRACWASRYILMHCKIFMILLSDRHYKTPDYFIPYGVVLRLA